MISLILISMTHIYMVVYPHYHGFTYIYRTTTLNKLCYSTRTHVKVLIKEFKSMNIHIKFIHQPIN